MISNDMDLLGATCRGRKLRTYDEGSGDLWVYSESLGPRGVVRADYWEEAFELCQDEIMDDAEDGIECDDEGNFTDADGGPVDCVGFRSNGVPTDPSVGTSYLWQSDINGCDLRELTEELAEELDIEIQWEWTEEWMRPVGPGNNYDPEDWPAFIAGINGPVDLGHPFGDAVNDFSAEIVELWGTFIDLQEDEELADQLNMLDDDEVIFRAYCSLAGEGIGLWDGSIMPESVGREFEKIISGVDHYEVETWIATFNPEFAPDGRQ